MARLSVSPELQTFLGSLRPGEPLSGTVTAIERFGVFVALDDGPAHPVFPGVGFITVAEPSWRHIEAASDVVRVGQRVTVVLMGIGRGRRGVSLSCRQVT